MATGIPKRQKYYRYFLFILIGSFFLACSPVGRYNVLSFFFDGVPDPYEIPDIPIDSLSHSDSVFISIRQKVTTIEFVVHKPYAGKGCRNCHDQEEMGGLILSQPALCYECHENLNEDYSLLHGPVAGGYCTTCHSPHKAKLENLLLHEGAQLCLNCHQQEQVLKNKAHANIQESSCLECHNPHGGETRAFLKSGLCNKCHNDINENHNFLHGPVAAGYCTECHSPHMVKEDKFLIRQEQELCLHCHEAKQIFENEIHKDIGKTNCMECHNPHGGEDQYILN